LTHGVVSTGVLDVSSKFGYFQKLGYVDPLQNFLPKSGLRKFRHRKSIELITMDMTVELVEHTMIIAERDKLDRRWSNKLIIRATVNG